MKGMKIGLCIVIAAAAVVMALGTTSASAATTKLCKVDSSPLPCPAAKTYPSGQGFEAAGNFFIGGEYCHFGLAFHTNANSGAPLPAEIVTFDFSSCPAGLSITAVHVTSGWSFPIEVTGTGPNGTGEVSGPSAAAVELDVHTSVPGNCFYELPNFKIYLEGGSYLSSSITGIRTSGGLGCPSTLDFGFEGIPGPELFVTE